MLLPVIIAIAGLAGRSDPPIKVTLNSDVYAVGEDAARVHVKVAQDGYIVILRADVDGRIRVLVPVDPGVDNFLRGGKDYDVRGRGDRDDTFQIESREGTGTVLAAWSASPLTFDHFIRGDHWDYRVLGSVPSDEDAETVLLDVVREMAGENGHFDYDVVHYQVASGGGGYGHTHVAFGVGYGWGGWGYSPWTFGIGFGYGFGCWACWPSYGYGFYPYGYGFYPYGYYPYSPYYYGYGYGHVYYPYGRYPSAYPYYLHSPYAFKPGGTGGPLVQPRPRSGGAFTAGFSGGARSAPPRYSAPGFGPRTRTPASGGARVNQVDPRAREWDRQRMDAGQHRQPPPPKSQPRSREQPHGNSGGSHGSGGQAQPRSREPHGFSQLSETGRGWGGTRSRSNSDRSYGGWGGLDRRQLPSSSYRGFSGGSFGNRGMSGARGFTGGGFGGRSSAPSSGGGFRGGGGGGGARAPANGRHR